MERLIDLPARGLAIPHYSLWAPLLLVAGSVCLFVGLFADQPVLLAIGFLGLLAKPVLAIASLPVLLSEEWAYWKKRARSRRIPAP